MIRNIWAFRSVMRDARLTTSRRRELASKRLKAVLASAYRRVPYYRDSMRQAGYDPERDYLGPEDLGQLPITTKETLKSRPLEDFLDTARGELSGYFTDATSGSTGIPLRIYRTPEERALQIAKWLRVLFLNGYEARDRVMSLTSPARLNEGRSRLQTLGLFRRLSLDYLLPPEEKVDALLRYRPDVLYGNRSHLVSMAQELRRRGLRPGGLKILAGTAEIIRDNHRRILRDRFGLDLTETYGSVEMGTMAYETPARDGLHLCEDLTCFEFLDSEDRPASPGTPARVVVTDLSGRLMPFIRYDQGDQVVFEEIRDERGDVSRRLTRIMGRDDDYAVLPDGSRRSYQDFYEVMDKYQGIAQFRFVQRARDRFEVLIAADDDYLSRVRESLLFDLGHSFPPTVTFEIVRVDEIDADPNGKTRMLISEVDQPS